MSSMQAVLTVSPLNKMGDISTPSSTTSFGRDVDLVNCIMVGKRSTVAAS